MQEKVVIVSCLRYDDDEIQAAMNRAVQKLGGWEQFVSPGQSVLLKPNFIKSLPPAQQAITHPVFLRALAGIITSIGAYPAIGDSPAFGSVRGIASQKGAKDALRPGTIPLMTFKRKKWVDFPKSGFKHIPLARELEDFDTFINVPKLKAHGQLRFTGATKNVFGVVCGRWKAFQHFKTRNDLDRFGRFIAELARFIHPPLTLIDAVTGMLRTGPSGGDPYDFGCIIAGVDMFAMDTALARLFDVPWENVPILRGAAELGYINPDTVDIDIDIESPDIAERLHEMKLPTKLAPISFSFPRLVKGFFRHLRQKYFYLFK